MIVKYAIANVSVKEIAERANDNGLSGSVVAGFGFGSYGIEPTVFIEMATGENATESLAAMDRFVKQILFSHHEEAAYRTIDSQDAVLLHVTGRIDRI